MGTYDRKRRDIKKSLNRRSRMRRAYFKMIGEDPKKPRDELKPPTIDEEINLSDVTNSDKEDQRKETLADTNTKMPKTPKKSLGKKLFSKKRAEKYHKQKEAEGAAKLRQEQRLHHRNIMQKRTSRGQPRLGAQMGVLSDKIKKSS